MAWLDVTQYESNNTGRHRYDADQLGDNDGFTLRWRFGGYDQSSSRVHNMVSCGAFGFAEIHIREAQYQ